MSTPKQTRTQRAQHELAQAQIAHLDAKLKASRVEHTAGPWTVRDGIYIDAPTCKDVAQVRGAAGSKFLNPDAEIEANARLVAAAPELLAVLRRVQEVIKSGEDLSNEAFFGSEQNWIAMAISKAEGRA